MSTLNRPQYMPTCSMVYVIDYTVCGAMICKISIENVWVSKHELYVRALHIFHVWYFLPYIHLPIWQTLTRQLFRIFELPQVQRKNRMSLSHLAQMSHWVLDWRVSHTHKTWSSIQLYPRPETLVADSQVKDIIVLLKNLNTGHIIYIYIYIYTLLRSN